MGRSISTILLAVSLVLLLASPPVQAILIQGNVYDYTLDRAVDVVVSINTTPQQRIITKNGMYQFRAEPGSYTIIAVENSGKHARTVENITLSQEGTFTLDLILTPEISDSVINDSDFPADALFPAQGKGTLWIMTLLIIGLAIVVLVIIVLLVFLRRERKKMDGHQQELKAYIKEFREERRKESRVEKVDQKEEKTKQEVPQHLTYMRAPEEVVRVKPVSHDPDVQVYEVKESSDTALVRQFIKEHSPTTQKEIREQFPYISEAKISLMISELEHDGHVRKIKKGRGNIVSEKGP